MPTEHATVCTYTGPAGERHEITVDVDATGSFRVLDVGPARTLLVERLGGADDDPARAIACARDYAAQVVAYHAARAPTCRCRRRSAATRWCCGGGESRPPRCRRPPDAPWPSRARRPRRARRKDGGGWRGPAGRGRDTPAAMARPPTTTARPR